MPAVDLDSDGASCDGGAGADGADSAASDEDADSSEIAMPGAR